MSWGIVGTFAATAISSSVQGGNAAAAGIAGQTQQHQSNAQAWNNNTAENKALAEANLQNTIRTGYKAGLLQVQRAQAKKALLERGISLGRSKQQALSAATANAAAAGQVGNSVDAVIDDINGSIGEAEVQLDADYEMTAYNFDLQLKDLLMSGSDAIKSSTKINVTAPGKVNTPGDTEAIMSGLVAGGSMWLQSNMKLGLGTPTAPQWVSQG